MLNDELEYFISNQTDLVNKYLGKVLVIKDKKVIGVYHSALEAYIETQKEHPLGTFMIQTCTPGPEAYTVTISTTGIII